MTTVSVVLPVRDADPRLWRRALTSTLRSRGVDFEVVVVDHGSVVPVDVAVAGDDDRVRVVRIGRDVAFTDALNAGTAVADADLIARMDSDDVMHPDRLRAQVDALASDSSISVVSSRIKILPKASLAMRGYAMWQNAILDDDAHRRERFIEQPLCQPATTMRRSALDDVGGYVAGEFPEDYDLFLRLMQAGHRFAKLPAVHHGWRQHSGQLTRRTDRDVIARLKARLLKTAYDLGTGAAGVIVVGAGKEGRRMSRAFRSVDVDVIAFVDVDPAKQARLVHEVAVHPPAWLAEGRATARLLVGAVGTSGARGAVRGLFNDIGAREGADAVIVS